MSRCIDLTGQNFGYWHVIERAENDKNGRAMWLCECKCGNKKIVSGKVLRNGNSKSCGCYKSKVTSERMSKNLTNQRFGSLVAIRKIEGIKSGTNNVWECKCDCGKIIQVSSNHLLSGGTKSCGCSRKTPEKIKFASQLGSKYGSQNSKDITNQKFGFLTAIEPTEQRSKYGDVIWLCKCDCGNEIYTSAHSLLIGDKHSCGCSKYSKGEDTIKNILLNNNIFFEQEKTFDSCRFSDTNALAKFDFYVNNKYLIEFDGVQHFEPVDYFGGEIGFIKAKERDNYKNQWCKQNNIPLIRIPYTHLNNLNIEDLLIEKSKFKVE